jgi:flavin-dependent dehydrogenase
MTSVVIGGGLAGAAVAIRLAQTGRDVMLLEREAGAHDKVCGEFLSFEAVDSLRALGLEPLDLGAVAIRALDVCVGARRSRSVLPFPALSLSRRVLDEALLSRAAAVGAQVRRGVRATGAERLGDAWTVRTVLGDMAASDVFLATGKHDLKGAGRPPGRQNDLIGFKVHLKLAEPLGPSVELHLFRGGYAGLEPIEDGVANLCLVVRKSVLAAAGGSWDGLLTGLRRQCPHLEARLDGATALSPRPLAIAAIPYGYVRTSSDGLWRLGDQAAVIPSLAGEGMAIALRSARLAADFAVAGHTPDAFQRALAGELRAQVGRATLVSRMIVTPLGPALVGAALAVAPSLAAMVAKGTRLKGADLNRSGISG